MIESPDCAKLHMQHLPLFYQKFKTILSQCVVIHSDKLHQ